MHKQLVFRPARSSDLDGAVTVFQMALPDSVWAKVGRHSTREYLGFYLNSPHELLIVANEEKTGVVGFCLGSSRPTSLPRALYAENFLALFAALSHDILRHPSVLAALCQRMSSGAASIFRALMMYGSDRAPAEQKFFPEACHVSLFAVHPEWRGQHIGTRLLETYTREMATRGYHWCTARTTTRNLASQSAQRRAGFRCIDEAGDTQTFVRELLPDPTLAAAADIGNIVGSSTNMHSAQRSFTPRSALDVRVLASREHLTAVSDDYDRLWLMTPCVSGFQTFHWLSTYWEAYASALGTPLVIVFSAPTTTVGILLTHLGTDRVLRFIGAGLSNYCGPVFDPQHLHSVISAFRLFVDSDPQILGLDLDGLRERSPFFQGLLTVDFGRLGRGRFVATNSCPELDLDSGWTAILGHQSPKQRAHWQRKVRRLGELGRLAFSETSSPSELGKAFPRLVTLYEARWHNKRILGAFSRRHAWFQLKAAMALGERSLNRLSTLTLDGDIIAFSYALCAPQGVATSYVLAHDRRFGLFSPGAILRRMVIDAAVARGDSSYDFSLGDTPYKAAMSSGHQRVFSATWGKNRELMTLKRRARVLARGIPILRRLKQDGLCHLFFGGNEGALQDQPGLRVIHNNEWFVYRLDSRGPDRTGELTVLGLETMKTAFSPRLLDLALDRHFRGDRALALLTGSDLVAVLWKASRSREQLVTGGRGRGPMDGSVYYQPILVIPSAIELLMSVLSGGAQKMLVCSTELSMAGQGKSRFEADLHFRPV